MMDLKKITSIFNSKYFNNTIFALGGFLLCLYLTRSNCVQVPTKTEVIDNTWVEHHTDTVYSTIIKEVPKPVIIYKTVQEIPETIQDSIIAMSKRFGKDTVYTDTSQIALNYYQDSIITDDYQLTWTAETFGFLTSMVTNVDVFKDSTVTTVTKTERVTEFRKPNFSLGAGISSRLNYKLSAGYKGWMVEVELDKQKFNQIYLTKIFHF